MPTNTYEPILTKGPESTLPSVEDGKLRITSDTGRIFIDDNNTRTEVTDFIKGMTENEIKSLLAPIASKIYIASDTGKFMTYNTSDDEWNNIAVVDTDSGQVVTDITRNGFDFIATRLNGSTFSFTQQQYTGNNGIALSGTTFSNSGVRSISEGTTAGTINVNTNGSTANISVKDAGKAVKSITRSGTTFTATALDGSTFSFTQQDNDTKYTGANGISLSGTTFSNSGVRSIATGTSNGTINVNTNGSTSNIAVKGLGSAAYTESSAYASSDHTHNYAGSSSAGGIANSSNLLYYTHQNEVNFLGGNQTVCYFNYRDASTDAANATTAMTYKFCNYSNDTSKSTLEAGNYNGKINGYTIAASVPSGAKFTDTTYTGSNGVSLSGTTFSNSGVRSITSGTSNGTINVNTNGSTANVSVYGLGSNAYTSTDYLPLAGGTMTGTVITPINEVVINFRNHASYYCTASYQTAGNEALVFATKNPVTSFMFVSGEDSVTNHAQDRWRSLTPGLQIKQNCVSINKLIADGTTPTYNLEVGGTEYVSGALTTGGVFKGTCGEFTGGRVYNAGDDEGVIIKTTTGGYAGLILGSHNARRSVFYLNSTDAFWRYNNGTASYDIKHPVKAGTIALTSDISALQSNFQAGVNSVYNAVVARGVTPASKSLSDVVTGINNIPSVYKSSLELIKTQNGSSEVTQGYCYDENFSQNITFTYPIKLNAGKYLLLVGARFDWSTTLTDQSSVTNGSFYVQSYTQPTSNTRFNGKFEYIITMTSAGTFSVNIKSSDADQSRVKAMLMKIS